MANSDAVPSVVTGAPFTLRSAPGGAIVLGLASGVPFDQLRARLRELLAETPGRFKGASFRLDLAEREVDLFELRRLIGLCREHGVDVIGLHCAPVALQRFAERELKLKVHLSAPEPARPPEAEAPAEEQPTVLVAPPEPDPPPEVEGGKKVLTLHTTLRSGARVHFGGDVQVFGDINPGAEVVAGGSIYVFGALKGLACAGAHGDDTAVVFALDMRPTQLRIGKVIEMATDPTLPDRPHRGWAPEVAWIADGSVRIEPYRGRHPLLKESP